MKTLPSIIIFLSFGLTAATVLVSMFLDNPNQKFSTLVAYYLEYFLYIPIAIVVLIVLRMILGSDIPLYLAGLIALIHIILVVALFFLR